MAQPVSKYGQKSASLRGGREGVCHPTSPQPARTSGSHHHLFGATCPRSSHASDAKCPRKTHGRHLTDMLQPRSPFFCCGSFLKFSGHRAWSLDIHFPAESSVV